MNRTNPHLTRSGRDIAQIRKEIQEARAHPFKLPEGHVAAVCFAKVFGPRNATTPSGEPITIGSGVFDLTVETPESAMAKAAKRWMGIEPHLAHWAVELEADVAIDPSHPMHAKVQWSKLFHLRYLPEQATKWKERGLHDGNVPNHFLNSWFLKNHKIAAKEN